MRYEEATCFNVGSDRGRICGLFVRTASQRRDADLSAGLRAHAGLWSDARAVRAGRHDHDGAHVGGAARRADASRARPIDVHARPVSQARRRISAIRRYAQSRVTARRHQLTVHARVVRRRQPAPPSRGGHSGLVWLSLLRPVRERRLSLDNNLSERNVRPVAIGRKNCIYTVPPGYPECASRPSAAARSIGDDRASTQTRVGRRATCVMWLIVAESRRDWETSSIDPFSALLGSGWHRCRVELHGRSRRD